MNFKNLIQVCKKEDFGPDLNIKILSFENWSILQCSIGWSDYPDWPYLQVMMGNNTFFGVLFFLYKFSFTLDIISRTWVHFMDDTYELPR